MLRIDRLRIGLPAGMESRADRVARLVGEELAKTRPAAGGRIESLALGRIEMPAGATDRQWAARIAGAIHQRIGGPSDA